jgi:polysaccharide export outer membrane protein
VSSCRAALVVAALAACPAWAAKPAAKPVQQPAKPAQQAAKPADAARPHYRIGPGDVLQVFVWKEPDLSRDVTVRLDGRLTLPLIGDVDAAGRTPAELALEITERLKRFLEAPQVTLGVSQANSSRFFVLGLVTNPGAYPMTGRTTLLQALAQAQGFRDFAKLDRIVVIRGPEGQQTFRTVNYKKLEAGADVSQNIVLEPGDTVLVP